MVIKIPKARSERPSTSRGGVSLASGDVPTVSPASDPGLRVPLENNVGEGLQQAGAVLEDVSDTAYKINQREEGLSRESLDTSYYNFLNEQLRNLQKTEDLSDSSVIEKAGQLSRAEQDRILSEYKGSNSSREMLKNRLTQRRNEWSDTLAVMNINAADKRLNSTVERRLSAVSQEIFKDPDVLSDDPMRAFRKYADNWEQEIDFLGLNEAQKQVVRSIGQAEIINDMITPLIANEEFDRAKDIVRSPEIAEVVPPEMQRDLAQRIITAEKKVKEDKGVEYLNMAQTILGPNATEAEIRQAAKDMAGIKEQKNLEFFTVGNRVLALNKDTGALVGSVTGETPEQEAERTRLKERAKLLAKSDVLNQILRDAGAEELPTEAEPTAETGKTPGKAPAEGAQITVGPLSRMFGTDAEASEDAQEVARLFMASRRMLLIDEPAIAGSLMAQARFIAENSSEIQKLKELDKPILDPKLASEFGVAIGTPYRGILGVIPKSASEKQREQDLNRILSPQEASELNVPLGTTVREVEGITPRSPESRSEDIAYAGARGRGRADAEEQISFIDEATLQIDDLLDEIEKDPTIVGLAGALRATGRSALTALHDIGFGAIVDRARDIAFYETELGFDEAFALFENPALSSLDIMGNSMGLVLARMYQPTGRLSVDVIKRSIKSVNLEGFVGSDVVQDRLEFVLKLMDQRKRHLKKRFGLEEQKPSTSGGQIIPPGTSSYKIENGKLVPTDQQEGTINPQEGGDSGNAPFDQGDLEGTEETQTDTQVSSDEGLVNTIKSKYKGLANYDFNIIDSRAKGISDGRKAEFYPAEENDNPLRGKPTVEIFDPSLKDADLENMIVADFLHNLSKEDPVVSGLRGKFASTLTKRQKQIDKNAYKEAKSNGEKRSFEDWLDQSRMDQYLIAQFLPKGSQDRKEWLSGMTPEQRGILSEIEHYMRVGPDGGRIMEASGKVFGSDITEEDVKLALESDILRGTGYEGLEEVELAPQEFAKLQIMANRSALIGIGTDPRAMKIEENFMANSSRGVLRGMYDSQKDTAIVDGVNHKGVVMFNPVVAAHEFAHRGLRALHKYLRDKDQLNRQEEDAKFWLNSIFTDAESHKLEEAVIRVIQHRASRDSITDFERERWPMIDSKFVQLAVDDLEIAAQGMTKDIKPGGPR